MSVNHSRKILCYIRLAAACRYPTVV